MRNEKNSADFAQLDMSLEKYAYFPRLLAVADNIAAHEGDLTGREISNHSDTQETSQPLEDGTDGYRLRTLMR